MANKNRYGTQRAKSSLSGAASGAALGTSALPGIGTAIGAGVGGLAGLLLGGPTDAQRLRDEELDKLMMRQKLNALGLTKSEEDALSRRLLDPVKAQQSEATKRRLAAMQMGDVGGGAYAKAALKQGEDEAAALMEGNKAIAQADILARREDEQRIQQLQAEREEQEQAQTQAALKSVFESGASAVAAGAEFKALKDKEDQLAKLAANFFGQTSGVDDMDKEQMGDVADIMSKQMQFDMFVEYQKYVDEQYSS